MQKQKQKKYFNNRRTWHGSDDSPSAILGSSGQCVLKMLLIHANFLILYSVCLFVWQARWWYTSAPTRMLARVDRTWLPTARMASRGHVSFMSLPLLCCYYEEFFSILTERTLGKNDLAFSALRNLLHLYNMFFTVLHTPCVFSWVAGKPRKFKGALKTSIKR